MSRFYLNDDAIPKVQKLMDQGLSATEMGLRLGFKDTTINKFIKRHKLKKTVLIKKGECMSAIEAEMVNYKLINGRKVMQIILEVPIENANHIVSVLGWPNPAESKWVGVALLAKHETRNPDSHGE